MHVARSSHAQGGVSAEETWEGAAGEDTVDTELAIGLGLGFGIPACLLGAFLYYYRHKKNRKGRLRKEQIVFERLEKENAQAETATIQKQLNDLQDSMQSMMEVFTPWNGVGTGSVSRVSQSPQKSASPDAFTRWCVRPWCLIELCRSQGAAVSV